MRVEGLQQSLEYCDRYRLRLIAHSHLILAAEDPAVESGRASHPLAVAAASLIEKQQPHAPTTDAIADAQLSVAFASMRSFFPG
jgi:hypothetical protein